MTLTIKKTEDFRITEDNIHPAWDKAEWNDLTPVGPGKASYKTKAKLLWSDLGIYVLFECEDKILSCSKNRDFDEIYLEDVVEFFFWPDEKEVVYFEYELSPLGYELPLIVVNNGKEFHGWLPFVYKEERQCERATKAYGGAKLPYREVTGWKGEFFIPFKLVKGLNNCPPKAGTKWRGNLCRIDYDEKPHTMWSWSPETGENFHDYNNYGTFIFE